MVDVMSSLSARIYASVTEFPGPTVEKIVFGTEDPTTITEAFEEFVSRVLSNHISACLFYKVTVGVVVGVELADGNRCVIKAHQPRWSRDLLEASARVQAHLSGTRFPCPRPLADPSPLGLGWATVDAYLPDPGQEPIVPEMMAASAQGLAEVVTSCRGLEATPLTHHPFTTPSGQLYPEPHSPVFDFEATAAGAEWIDELARAAKGLRATDTSEPVIAHSDWSARNVRLGRTRVLAAYDWDSLVLGPETAAVGAAAATWSALAEPGDPVAPSPEEVVEYVRDYEAARGAPFSGTERRATGGAALWVLAYTARCEHALPPEWQHRRARPRLEVDGRRFLELDALF